MWKLTTSIHQAELYNRRNRSHIDRMQCDEDAQEFATSENYSTVVLTKNQYKILELLKIRVKLKSLIFLNI